jgi:hypothetical protein
MSDTSHNNEEDSNDSNVVIKHEEQPDDGEAPTFMLNESAIEAAAA